MRYVSTLYNICFYNSCKSADKIHTSSLNSQLTNDNNSEISFTVDSNLYDSNARRFICYQHKMEYINNSVY